MEQYVCSNSNINLTCEEIGKFLLSASVERRVALHIKLIFEEILLKYQEKLGENASFGMRLVKRAFSTKVEMIVPGEAYDVLDKEGEEDDMIRGLLAGIGLAPTWSYKHGKNHIIFIPKKKPLSGTIKLVAAIGLAIMAGMLLNLLPIGIRAGVNDYFLTPATNAFMGLLSAVAGPLIFLSVLGSICSMGNMDTLGKIGSKTIKVILSHMAVIGLLMTATGCLFYPAESGSSGTASFSQVLDLVYGIIPSNLFEPFLTGNTLQLIFIAIMIGLAMLMISSKVSAVFELVEQLSSIVQTLMAALSSMLPILILILFTGMITNGSLNVLLGSWKPVLLIIFLIMLYYVINLVRIALSYKISPVLLWKKAMPTFMVALTTASSAASFLTNTRDANQKLGINQKLIDFSTPLGQVLFMPAFIAMLFGIEVGLAEACHIPITISWLLMGLVTNLLVAFAIPPIPGGAVIGLTIVFAQLGLPSEVMAVAIAINALVDFPATAVNVSAWQLTLIDVADSLDMLDQETLQKTMDQVVIRDKTMAGPSGR